MAAISSENSINHRVLIYGEESNKFTLKSKKKIYRQVKSKIINSEDFLKKVSPLFTICNCIRAAQLTFKGRVRLALLSEDALYITHHNRPKRLDTDH